MKEFDLLSLRKLIMKNKIVLTFEGKMSQGVLINLVETLKEKLLASADNEVELEDSDSRQFVVKKVYAIFIELAQNIQNHSAEKVLIEGAETGVGIIVIREDEECFTITSGNQVTLSKADSLNKYCEELNGLSSEEIRKLYRTQLRRERQEGSRGAGIGLLEVTKKTGNPIVHSLTKDGAEHYFFTLSIRVNKEA